MGLGTGASLYQGIQSIAEAPARKRRFLNDAHRDARITALRNQRHTNFFPTNAIDARYKADAVAREARENPAFQGDPSALVPFLMAGTALAGGIYDWANEPAATKPDDPNSLKHYMSDWKPSSGGGVFSTVAPSASRYQTPANFGEPRTRNFTSATPAPPKPWWQL